MKKILLGVAASVLCAVAGAEERGPLMDFLHGTYNGGAFGHTTISNYCPDGAYLCNDQRDVAFKMYGGLRMTDYLGTELGFISFGRVRSLMGGGISTPISELSTRTNGFVFNLAPRWGISEHASVIGRLGFARWHVEGYDGATRIDRNADDQPYFSLYLGAAADYRVNAFVPDMLKPLLNNLSVQLSWDASHVKYLNKDHWMNMVSVGTQLEF